jgi:putative addiction module component (TIGR02574 family)
MTDIAMRLKDEILQLSEADRAELAHLILNSLHESDEEYDAAWEAELDRRFAEIESGKVVGIPADVVFAEFRRKNS